MLFTTLGITWGNVPYYSQLWEFLREMFPCYSQVWELPGKMYPCYSQLWKLHGKYSHDIYNFGDYFVRNSHIIHNVENKLW